MESIVNFVQTNFDVLNRKVFTYFRTRYSYSSLDFLLMTSYPIFFNNCQSLYSKYAHYESAAIYFSFEYIDEWNRVLNGGADTYSYVEDKILLRGLIPSQSLITINCGFFDQGGYHALDSVVLSCVILCLVKNFPTDLSKMKYSDSILQYPLRSGNAYKIEEVAERDLYCTNSYYRVPSCVDLKRINILLLK